MTAPPPVLAVVAAAAPGEAPLHYAPADLDARARYQDGHLVVTERSVLAIAGGRVVLRHARRPGDRFAAHVMTGSGLFLLLPDDRGEASGAPGSRALARFIRKTRG